MQLNDCTREIYQVFIFLVRGSTKERGMISPNPSRHVSKRKKKKHPQNLALLGQPHGVQCRTKPANGHKNVPAAVGGKHPSRTHTWSQFAGRWGKNEAENSGGSVDAQSRTSNKVTSFNPHTRVVSVKVTGAPLSPWRLGGRPLSLRMQEHSWWVK